MTLIALVPDPTTARSPRDIDSPSTRLYSPTICSREPSGFRIVIVPSRLTETLPRIVDTSSITSSSTCFMCCTGSGTGTIHRSTSQLNNELSLRLDSFNHTGLLHSPDERKTGSKGQPATFIPADLRFCKPPGILAEITSRLIMTLAMISSSGMSSSATVTELHKQAYHT